MADKKGLTLLEVVFLIAIIVVVVGLLLPRLTHRGEPAYKAACKNNMKNISLMCKMYCQDFDDVWPCESTKGNSARENLYLLFKVDICDNPDIFYCPVSKGERLSEFTSSRDMANTDYAYVDGVPEDYNDHLLSLKPIMADAWEGHSDPSDGKWTHKGGSNVAWGDGHVSWENGWYAGTGELSHVK